MLVHLHERKREVLPDSSSRLVENQDIPCKFHTKEGFHLLEGNESVI